MGSSEPYGRRCCDSRVGRAAQGTGRQQREGHNEAAHRHGQKSVPPIHQSRYLSQGRVLEVYDAAETPWVSGITALKSTTGCHPIYHAVAISRIARSKTSTGWPPWIRCRSSMITAGSA